MICSRSLIGFTLIEISIVLVIIGLVLGGVLIGRDLIKASQMHAQIAQLESLDSAVNTFRNKYNCLPGDCGSAFAIDLVDSSTKNGNANGAVQSSGCTQAGTEAEGFWEMLSRSGLIPEAITSGGVPGVNSPRPKMPGQGMGSNARGGVWLNSHGYPSGQFRNLTLNSWYLTSLIGVSGGGIYSIYDGYALDTKIDDAMPNSGRVRANIESMIAFNMATGECALGDLNIDGESPTQCVDLDQDNTYNLSVAASPTPYELCAMVVKASF